jgi:hypothetical protein
MDTLSVAVWVSFIGVDMSKDNIIIASKISVDSEGTRSYNDNGDLISITGQNKNGEIGMWYDEEGLCSHERTSTYCEDCNENEL